jgi:hypothetical protein
MTYQVRGLDKAAFEPMFSLSDEELYARRARRQVASGSGEPCRVSLKDASAGETVILLNHVSHDVETPFRTSHAIYVRELAEQAPVYADELPPMLDVRTLGLRAFDAAGVLRAGSIARPGKGDMWVRRLLEQPGITEVHAHNAAYGCFLAKIVRN